MAAGRVGAPFEVPSYSQRKPLPGLEEYLITPEEPVFDLPTTPGQAEQAQADPRAVAAQQEALRYLQQVGLGGFTPEELASLRQSRASQLAGERAAFDTDVHLAEQRGVTGIDVADVARSAAQGTGMRTALGDMDQQALAKRRALEATRAQFDLASRMRAGSFGEAERRAAAQQARDRMSQEFSNSQAQLWQNMQNQAARQNAEAQGRFYSDVAGRYGSEMETTFGNSAREREWQRTEQEAEAAPVVAGATALGTIVGGAYGGPGGAAAGGAGAGWVTRKAYGQ